MRDNKALRHRGQCVSATFLILLLIAFFYSVPYFLLNYGKVLKEFVCFVEGEMKLADVLEDVENDYNEAFHDQDIFLDLFSVTQLALGKHETRNFDVVKSNDGNLYLGDGVWPSTNQDLQYIVERYCDVYNETLKYGGKMIYVQVPYKNAKQKEELVDYTSDMTEESEDYLVQQLRAKGIPVLDLRNYDECKCYYKTDNHWTAEASLAASSIISEEIEKTFDIDLIGHDYYGDANNYEPIIYKESFLGTVGVRVGPYYTGMDDFVVLNPLFETDLNYRHYAENELKFEYSGDFWDAFIGQDTLESEFVNKYYAFLHGGYAESVVINNMAQSDYTGLLVTHSYGRPLAQYMSLNFKEFRFIDPHKERYGQNVIDYVREYKPDIVVLMYNGFIEKE